MKKPEYQKSTIGTALLWLLLAVLPVSAQDVLIETESDLRTFASNVNNGTDYRGQTICLTTNITLTNGTWMPIGTSGHPFNGFFEGWGHSISELSINAGSSDYQGLFGYVDGGSIHDVAVTGSGSVTGGSYVGGICGYLASGEIVSCYSEIAVTGTTAVGGICGMQAGGKIKDSYVLGLVSGSNYVGAIVGSKATGTLKNCLYDVPDSSMPYAIGDDSYSSNDNDSYVMPFATITNENIGTWAENLNDEKNNVVWKLTVGGSPQLRSFLKNEPLTFTFTAEKHWLTVCPNGNYTVPAGMKAYIVNNVGADCVSLKEVTTLNEGRGALLYSETAGEFNVTSTDGALDDYSSDMWLKGSHVSPVTIGGADKNDYILSKGQFVRSGSGQLARGKAYLCLPASSEVKQFLDFVMDDAGDANGIGSIDNGQLIIDNCDDVWYDLNGQRFDKSRLKKGVYIVNGKKIIK